MLYTVVPKKKDSKLVFPLLSLLFGAVEDAPRYLGFCIVSPSLELDSFSLRISGSYCGQGGHSLPWLSFLAPGHAALPHTAQDAPASHQGAYGPSEIDTGSQPILNNTRHHLCSWPRTERRGHTWGRGW